MSRKMDAWSVQLHCRRRRRWQLLFCTAQRRIGETTGLMGRASSRDVTAGTVSVLSQKGQVTEAIEALGVLVQTQGRLSPSLLYAVLKSCVVKKDLILGRLLHALTVRQGYESDTFLCNHIVRMYGSHGRLQEAMDVFTMVAEPNAFMWCSIICAHGKHGRPMQAVELYHRMGRSSVKPDGHVFVAALQACARGGDIKSGEQVHADVLASGLEPDMFVYNALVDMYAKCGRLEEARGVFDGLPGKDVVTWTALIGGYSQQGRGQEALHLYTAMQEKSVGAPDSVTYVCLLQACANVGAPALKTGKQLHAQVGERGLDLAVGSSLVNMYAKCGSLLDARGVFDRLCRKDVVTWNAMIAGYSQRGMGQEALYLYSNMLEEGSTAPDSVTFVCLLQACSNVGVPALEAGKQLHAAIGERGLLADVVVANSLVNMYAKCGSLQNAQESFDGLEHKDVVTWNAMIAAYSQRSMGQQALNLYTAMLEPGTMEPNTVTFVCLLKACAGVGTPALDKGKELHAQIVEGGLQADTVVGCSLVNMYAKCGSLRDAQSVFNGLSEKNVVSWTALISGYAQQGMDQEALHLYTAMQEEGLSAPDSVTFVCLLQACANVAALHTGKQLHVEITEHGLHTDVFVAISLIDMYGKSGSMVDAQLVFDALPDRDIVVWNALIAGYSRQGDFGVVFDVVDRMREHGIQPDGVTLVSVLTVCSHAGLVNTGREYFESMTRHCGLKPTVEHYTCLVDLLGRAGQLEEALAIVKTIPVPPDAAIWHTLLGACRKWSNVNIACHAFDEAVKLDEKDAAAYVFMSNIYASAQMLEEAQEMQRRRIKIRAWKQAGQSWWTDTDGLVHTFAVGDMKHVDREHIYKSLKQLSSQIFEGGD